MLTRRPVRASKFSTLIVRSLRHSVRVQGGFGGRASPAFCQGTCRLAHCHQPCRVPQFGDALDNALPKKASTRLLMPSDRAARPCHFLSPELSIIVHNFTHQLFDQLLADPAVLAGG